MELLKVLSKKDVLTQLLENQLIHGINSQRSANSNPTLSRTESMSETNSESDSFEFDSNDDERNDESMLWSEITTCTLKDGYDFQDAKASYLKGPS
jgi:hypothetical protein